MTSQDLFANERRARMAAERLLALKQAELHDANRKLALHARHLSDEIIVKREETEELKGTNARVSEDLAHATEALTAAERRLWDSLETIEDGFAVYSPDHHLIAANSAFLATFDGLEDVREGAPYARILRLMAEEGIVDIGAMSREEWIASAAARWHAPVLEPVTIRLWDERYIKLIDRRSRDGDMVSLALDITDTVRHERDLKEARNRAEAANRAKSAFLANMSHEIRTPMNGVVGMADLLAESRLDDEQRLYVQTIRSSGAALLELINDVLDFSKIEAEKLHLHPEPFDMERLLHDVMILLQPAAQEKGLELIIDTDMFLPARVIGDPGRLRQVLVNLVGNAVKFTNHGQVLVRAIGVPVADDTSVRIHITVEDTGIGIAPDKIEHVFGEFNQVEDDRNRSFDGTGLGLAISRQLVGLMGGNIWVDSTPGKGSCFGFHVTMPVEPATAANGPRALPAWVKRVVLIDQPHTNLAMHERQIAQLGLDVTRLAAGGDPAGVAQDGTVFLIGEPRDGAGPADLVAQIRAAAPGAPILLVIAADQQEPSGLDGCVILHGPLLRSTLTEALANMVAPVTPHDPPTVTDTQTTARQMRILAAEDNKTNRLVLAKMLKTLDIELEFAVNGVEAVALHDSFAPDLIFMDISMPLVDGKEATRRIRAGEAPGRHVPIVALTAHAMMGDADEILAEGLDHYLTKPLRKDAIVARILAECPADCRPPLARHEGMPPMTDETDLNENTHDDALGPDEWKRITGAELAALPFLARPPLDRERSPTAEPAADRIARQLQSGGPDRDDDLPVTFTRWARQSQEPLEEYALEGMIARISAPAAAKPLPATTWDNPLAETGPTYSPGETDRA